MAMQLGIRYSMVNTVTEFEENRRIAWQARPRGCSGTGRGGRVWRYELEPVDGGTKVTESWDISEDRQRFFLRLGGLPERTRAAMAQSLVNIEELTARSPVTGKRPATAGVVRPMVPLSVLDLATVAKDTSASDALADTTRLAGVAETLGYHRLWVAEHHGMPQVASSAPAVLIAHLAAATATIRVGAGGVMLPNHAPLVVAEQFATLVALHPGRIDLGLGRAPGTDPTTARALRRTAELSAEQFPDDVVELIGYLIETDRPPSHPSPVPGRGYLPEVWLLGSSTFSAQLAGLLGLPFSFAYHFSPGVVDDAVAQYRARFRPSLLLDRPRLMVAVSVLCADTDEEAKWLAGPSELTILQLRTGRLGPIVTPEEAAAYRYSPEERALVDSITASHLVGDPATVTRGLGELVERTGADEVMVATRAHSFEARAHSLSLVSAAWSAVGVDGAVPA